MTFSHSSRGKVAVRDSRVFLLSICLLAVFCGVSFAGQQSAQPASQPAATAPQGTASVSQSTPQQAVPTEQAQKGQSLFATQCAFCHGRDAAGGETGPDLTSSELVEKDVNGNEIGPVVRSGRIDKGMPPFNFSDADLAAVVLFIHEQKTRMDSKQGRRRTVQAEDLQTGNAEEGKQWRPCRCRKPLSRIGAP